MAGVVSLSRGVMNPLVGKLTTLMSDEYKKLKGVRKQASFLMHELSAMDAVLEKLELMDELEPDTRNWRDHVREMAYDMEDCIDDFMDNLGGADDKAGFIKTTIQRLKTLGARHRIAHQIKDLKNLAVEANERRMRYKIDDCKPSSGFVAVDPRVSVIYKEAAGLVGIDGPKEEVVNWLIDTEKKLKVVSIMGFGGLGKTTLAKQVFDGIGERFECKAFLSVSQRPDMTRLLNGLQLKLGMKKEEQSYHAREVQDIIDELRGYLRDKRYFVVVDDVWDKQTWEIIRCAFPENDHGDRVIVTTRVEDVARQACCDHRQCVYKMKPLSDLDSRKLFSNRVFGSKDCHPSQFEEVSAKILKKCGGLPLAIIAIASLLANRPAMSRKDWESIVDSIGTQFAVNSDLDGMKSILNLSYMHLPIYLRACFLHLGMYPEDQVMKRDDLVRQWIVEGLISNLHGQDLEAVGKSYFNELINRSLILPEGTLPGDVMFCRVHDMMLELILSKCAEHNFMSVAYSYETISRLHDYKYKVRRLSLKSNAGAASGGTVSAGTTSTSLSQVRSFALFGELSYTPALLLWKYLRVLVFETTGAINLTEISQLSQLRYLKVSASSDVNLPAEMKGLVRLETLEVYCVYLASIPPDVVHLPLLTHLVVSKYTRLPDDIKNMKSLRTLHGFNPWKSLPKDIEGLGELTNLRDLRLYKANGHDLGTSELAALVSSIGKLSNLKSLRIGGWTEDQDERLALLSDPPAQIEVLRLGKWLFSKVPKWIGGLDSLCHLYLLVSETSTEEVAVLGELPSLVHLSLWVEHIPRHSALVLGAGLFPALEDLKFHGADGDVTKYVNFQAGAIPKLRRLTLQFDEQDWGGATPAGLENLLALEQIHVYIRSRLEDREQVRRDAEYSFRSATRAHPSRPSFTIGG